MNGPSDDLFLLIKSLNATEKRYFRMFADRQGNASEKSYIKVFDLIETQKDNYDEKLLKQKLKKKSDIEMLPKIKAYLQDLILKSMRLYRDEKDVATEVFDLIHDELFYTEKGLVSMRAKTIKRAKELAYKHDLMYLLIAIIQRERIYALKFAGGDPLQHIEAIHAEETQVLQHLNYEAELGKISHNLWAQGIIDPLLNDKNLLYEFLKYKEHPLLLDYAQLQTFMEKISFLRCHTLICKFTNDTKGHFEYNKQIVDLFNDYPQHKFNLNINYIDALNNYLSASHKAGIYDEFEAIIEKLEHLPKEKLKDALSIEISVVNNKILYIMNTGKFYLSDGLIQDFENICYNYSKLITDSFFLVNNYNISVILFIKNAYKDALKHCLRVIEMKSKARMELQHGAQMMQMILHFELGDNVYLDSLCRNIIRNMKIEKRYNAFEQRFCSFIKKLIKTPEREQIDIFNDMFEEFIKMKKSSPENIYVFMTETLAWSKSKYENKPLQETIYYKFT